MNIVQHLLQSTHHTLTDVRKYENERNNHQRIQYDYCSYRYDSPYRYNGGFQQNRSKSPSHFRRPEKRNQRRISTVIIHEIDWTDPAQQVIHVTEIDSRIGATKIHMPIHHFCLWHVLNVVARSILWRITNAHLHCNKLRKT